MKTLTKIRLINWHIFWNDTINVKGNILITGENATGKSTLIDAIFFLLTGGNEKSFNSAANSKALRSLETYMRCKTGVDGKEFLRGGANVISHIALEFLDTNDQKPFVIGVALEIRDNSSKPDQKYYHVVDGTLDEICFFEGDKILNFRALADLTKKKNKTDFQNLDGSKSEIKSSISYILGINNRKFNELLPKALAFRPITEVSQFVYSFLLPEHNVNLERIRDDIKEFREIQETILRDEQKHNDLTLICNTGTTFRENKSKSAILAAYLKKLDLESLSKETACVNDRLSSARITEKDLKRQISNEESHIETINQKRYEIQNSDAYRVIQENEMLLSLSKKEETELAENERSFNSALIKLSEQAEELTIKNSILQCIDNKNFLELVTCLQKIIASSNTMKQSIQESLNHLYAGQLNLDIEIKQLQDSKDKLEKGLHQYPKEVMQLSEFIKAGLESFTGREEDVRPLCEFLEIDSSSEQWRNTIEGVLGNRRFDLVVRNGLFEKASELYAQFNREGRCANIGIVNGAIASEILENSLAKMVVTEDVRAKNYISCILGKTVAVKLEDGVQGLISKENSANTEAMYYLDSATRQASSDIYKTPYIGTLSIKIKLDNVKTQLEKCLSDMEETKLSIKKLEYRQKILNNLNPSRFLEEKNIWQIHSDCLGKIAVLEEENRTLRDNSTDLFSRLDSFKEELNRAKNTKENLENNLNETIRHIGSYEEKLNLLQSSLTEQRKSFEELLSDKVIAHDLDVFISTNKKSRKETEASLNALESSLNTLENTTIRLMSKYIDTYTFDSKANIDCLDDFYTELNQVIDRHLVQFREKANEAELNCRRGFQDSYIAEIRKHINDEKDNINRLNRILSTKPFGNDGEVYRFEVSKSKNPEFGIYYDVFMSNQDFNVNELFTDSLSAENSSLMNELFERITQNPANDREERILREFTDYRMFMDYDIKITNKNGEVSYFSKINREKSGGETQTPFYVIIAASFDQLARSSSKNDCGCPVILDEAFNNMDESRISAMMEYFNQLKIQLIIVVPPERFRTICKHVDTTIALSKSNNRAIFLTLLKDNE